MNIDVGSLGFLISLIDFLLVLILLLQNRICKNFLGPGWWVLGFVSTSTGFLLMLFLNLWGNRLLGIVLANSLFVLGSFLIYFGVRKFVGKKENLRMLLILIPVLILTMAAFTYLLDNKPFRTILVTGSLAVLTFLTAWTLLFRRSPVTRFSANFCVVVLLVYTVSLLLRIADVVVVSSHLTLFNQEWFQLYGFLITLVTHVFLAFGLIFMINQRLQGEMRGVKESLMQNQRQYQTFIDSTPDIVYLKDDRFCYQMINRAQAAFFGKVESDLLGKSDHDLMEPDAADGCHRSDKAVLDSLDTVINYEKVGDQYYETRKFPVRLMNGKLGVGAFIRDITEARKAEDALKREQTLMNALMNNLPHHIYFKDKESRFIRINNAHAKSFGLKAPGEETGKSDFDFFSEEHARKTFEDEQSIIRTGEPLIIEERETWADRPDNWVNTIKLPLLDHEGNIIGTFGISKDITERKLAEKEIGLKNQELQQMNSEKDKLFSIIAHDLRSPFNALLGLTEIMNDKNEKLTLNEIRETAGIVSKSANSLNDQLGNLLEWSRIQMTAISIDLVPQNLRFAADTELELFKEAAQKKQIRLMNSITDSMTVSADKQMLHSILRNLIANAIKFTKPGGSITVAADFRLDDFIEISVKDTGIGMSREILNNLFKLNNQSYRRGTEGEPSSGLGLTICKQLVEKQGGEIWAVSEELAGSTFCFTLRYK